MQVALAANELRRLNVSASPAQTAAHRARACAGITGVGVEPPVNGEDGSSGYRLQQLFGDIVRPAESASKPALINLVACAVPTSDYNFLTVLDVQAVSDANIMQFINKQS